MYNVVPSPETISPAAQPVVQNEEKRSQPQVVPAENAVQKHRRKQKENKVALEAQDVHLGVELEKRKKQMWELGGELKILSRLSGARPCHEVQDCINKVAEAER